MVVAVVPRETGMLNLVADFCDKHPKNVIGLIKELSMWITTCSEFAEVEPIGHEYVDLGNLASSLKLAEGAFDITAIVPGLSALDKAIHDRNRDVSNISIAAGTSLTSICKSVLWLDKLGVIGLGAMASPITIIKCATTICTMGGKSYDNLMSLGQASTRVIVATGREERIQTLTDTKQFYSLIRNVSIVALSFFALMAELAIWPIVPIVMLIFSTVSLIGTTGGFMASADLVILDNRFH